MPIYTCIVSYERSSMLRSSFGFSSYDEIDGENPRNGAQTRNNSNSWREYTLGEQAGREEGERDASGGTKG